MGRVYGGRAPCTEASPGRRSPRTTGRSRRRGARAAIDAVGWPGAPPTAAFARDASTRVAALAARSTPGLEAPVSDAGTSSPGFGASQSGFDAPKSGFDAPKSGFDAPKFVSEAPKSVSDAPKSVSDAPKFDFDAPKFVFDAPKFVFDASYVNFWIGYPDAEATESTLGTAPGRFGSRATV